MDVYAIPYQGKYIVYRPLKRLAFMANAALVNTIAQVPDATTDHQSQADSEAERFLRDIGFFEPDPAPPPSISDGQAFAPTVAVCLLTTACNFRCVYCYAASGERPHQELPAELGQRAIDIVCRNAIELGQTSFSLSFHGGGEPTLAQGSFKALVQYARSKELPCEISVASNGYWSSSLRDWVLDHLDQVSLSFDGTQALQDRQRPLLSGRGSFSVVIETIREMDSRAFPYGIRLTVTDAGIADLPKAIAFLCSETACKVFQIEPAFDHGRAHSAKLALADGERFADAFMEAYEIAASFGCHAYYSGARPWVLTDRFCQALDRALIVAPDGGLTSCYEVFGYEHPLASVFFFGSITADGIVSTCPGAREVVQRKLAERRALCEGCFCYWHCAGDCPPKVLSADGDGHRQFGVRCELNRHITRELLVRYLEANQGVWRGEVQSEQTMQEE